LNKYNIKDFNIDYIGDWGLGIGDLGFGVWGPDPKTHAQKP